MLQGQAVLVAVLCLAVYVPGRVKGAAVHGAVPSLPASCQSRLNSIYDQYYSASSTAPSTSGAYNCLGDCRTTCRQTVQQALDGRESATCPYEYDIQACMNLAQDAWVALANDCQLFSGPYSTGGAAAASPAALGGRRRLWQEGEGVAGPSGDTRLYVGDGCFPSFTNAASFQQWLQGTYTFTDISFEASLIFRAGASHGETDLPLSCQASMNNIYDTYYADNSTNKAQWGTFQCTGGCRTACKATIETALSGQDSTTCPAESNIQHCMNLAQNEWINLASMCAMLSAPFQPSPQVSNGLSTAMSGSLRRTLLQAAEGEGEGVVDVNERGYTGPGCFPPLLDVSQFSSWLRGTFDPWGPGKVHPVAVIMPVLYMIGIGSMAFF